MRLLTILTRKESMPPAQSVYCARIWWQCRCAAEEYDRWTHHFGKEGFAGWFGALRQFRRTDVSPAWEVAQRRLAPSYP